MTDELYDRLRAADPFPGTAPVEPAGSPGTRALMEAAMSTQLPTTPDDELATTGQPPRGSRLVVFGIAAAAAGVIVAGSVMVPDMLDDDSTPAPTALTLTMAGGDAMSSCLPVSVEILQQQQLAFAGTVTELTDDSVGLDVDTWYKGGQDAATVELASGPDLVGYSIDFQDGDRYLVSALDGTVSICGLSGEASPELLDLYEQAFGG